MRADLGRRISHRTVVCAQIGSRISRISRISHRTVVCAQIAHPPQGSVSRRYQSSVALVKPTPRLLHSLLSAFGFRSWAREHLARRSAQPRYRCAESAASPGGFSFLSTGTAEGQDGAAPCPARGGGVASSVYPSATADLSLGGLAEPGRQVVDTTRSSEAGTPPAALGSAVAAPTGGGAQGVRRSPLELPKHHVRSEGYLMPVARGARQRCNAGV